MRAILGTDHSHERADYRLPLDLPTFSTMRRLVRPIAVLLSFVLLQLVLVESGYACRMPMNGAMGGSEMAGMQVPGGADYSLPALAQSGEPTTPCQFPWAPAGCQGMTPCAPSALTVASTAVESFALVRVAPVQLVLLTPPALTSAPELPPPRA